jgi:DNA-binding transcriptional LysR family regulator
MRMLVAAVEAGSLSAASRRLGIPLPTLSRRIADLEAGLKAELLVRSTRGLAPTEAGTAYLAAARRILDAVEEAEQAAAGEWRVPRGEVVVTAPVVFGRLHVLPMAAGFLAAYPEIDLRLVLSDRNLGLADDHVDAALRIGALPDSGLKAIHLGDVRRIAVASPDFLAASGGPRAPSDLAALPCVAFEGLSADRVWSFRNPRGGPAIAVPVRRRLSVNTVEAAVDAAAAGIGVARAFTYQCAAALAAGTIVRVLRDFEPEPVPVHLLHAGREPLPLKLRRFLDHARLDLGRRLAELAA